MRSVVFLDKKLNESPSNLGISFGFELNEISNCNAIEPEVRTDNNINSNVYIGPNDSCVQSHDRREVLMNFPAMERDSPKTPYTGTLPHNNKALHN